MNAGQLAPPAFVFNAASPKPEKAPISDDRRSQTPNSASVSRTSALCCGQEHRRRRQARRGGGRIVPGALHVAFRRSDHAHALISDIGIMAAAAMRRVFGVYTARDFDDWVGTVSAASRMKDYHATTLYPLARGKLRYVGEPGVAMSTVPLSTNRPGLGLATNTAGGEP
jgi:hypothetical protein